MSSNAPPSTPAPIGPTPAPIGPTNVNPIMTVAPVAPVAPIDVDYGPLVFNTKERTEAEYNSIAATSSKVARQQLKVTRPADYSKMKFTLTKGSHEKLTITKDLVEKEGKLNLESITKAQYILKEIIDHLTQNDLLDSFMLALEFDDLTGGLKLNCAFSNLLDNLKAENEYTSLEGEELITTNMQLQSLYGKDYLLSDRQLSLEYLKNCCDSELTAKINEKMNQHENTEKGAPLFFFFMQELISPNLDTTVRAVVKCLDNMKITDYDGENVSQVITYLRTVTEYLTQNKALPNDYDNMVLDVMKTATTGDFIEEVKMLAFQRKREKTKTTIDSVLDELQILYHNLVASKKWTPLDNSSKEGATFAVDYTKSTCWNCGEKGHAVSQCSKPKDESAIKSARNEFFNARNKKGGSEGANDTSSGYKGKNPGAHKVPPKEGESHEKLVGSKTLHWCGKCGQWTGHRTSEHIEKGEKKTENTDSESANTESGATIISGATCANFH